MSEYPHDREWEISPEERSKKRRREHLRPPEHPDARGDGRPNPDPGSQPRTKPRRRQQPIQRHNQDDTDDQHQPSLLARILYKILAPIIGFIGFSLVTLTWTAIVVGTLLTYKPAAALSMGTIGLAVLIWAIGMSSFQKALVAIGQSR